MKNYNEEIHPGDVISISFISDKPKQTNSLAVFIGSSIRNGQQNNVFLHLSDKADVVKGKYGFEVAGLKNMSSSILYGMGSNPISVPSSDLTQTKILKYGALSRRDFIACIKSFGSYCNDIQARTDWKNNHQGVVSSCMKNRSYNKFVLSSATRLVQNDSSQENKDFFTDISKLSKNLSLEK
ncbi:MAG TPA: hypothetical protein VGK38_01555 [Prolixibacteraceae bacterium]|jgi:hypothetical protein